MQKEPRLTISDYPPKQAKSRIYLGILQARDCSVYLRGSLGSCGVGANLRVRYVAIPACLPRYEKVNRDCRTVEIKAAFIWTLKGV